LFIFFITPIWPNWNDSAKQLDLGGSEIEKRGGVSRVSGSVTGIQSFLEYEKEYTKSVSPYRKWPFL